MHQICDNQLWLGHAFDVREPAPLFEVGIKAIVDLAYEEKPACLPRQLTYCRFPLNDGGGNDLGILKMALMTIVGFLDTGTPQLVACSAGMSRSPTLAAFALAMSQGRTPEEVIQEIAFTISLELKQKLWEEVALVQSSTNPH